MLGLVLAAGACAVEQKTVVVPERVGVTVVDGNARIVAASQAACTSYGISRGTAHYDRCVQDEFATRRPG